MNCVRGPREELIQLLYLHREVSVRWLAGEADLAGSRARLAEWVTQQLRQRLTVKEECSARHAALIGQLVEATRPVRERRAA